LPNQFELTDADFEAFAKFLADKDYDYTSKSEDLLKSLKEVSQKENYQSAINADLTQLETPK